VNTAERTINNIRICPVLFKVLIVYDSVIILLETEVLHIVYSCKNYHVQYGFEKPNFLLECLNYSIICAI
jgi:hypothetical protein